jgi:tRNA threonylcarbamoyl adenosine modification protein YeaZ/ribosomal-protein-alanine acetyltransferase
VIGIAIEAATEHVEVLVRDDNAKTLALEVEDVGHGHTRRLTPLVERALERAGAAPRDLGWVAADLGPGSFTGVRVGLATARALALAAGARMLGASSLASLAHGTAARRAVLVPLVPAGRREVYAGFFRADTRGTIQLMSAPRVLTPDALLVAVAEARAIAGATTVRFVGPGAQRERATLAAAYPDLTEPVWRGEGLSAIDLADAALAAYGPARGLPSPGEEASPLYVRTAQAEERVRHRATAGDPILLRPLVATDIPAIAAVERLVFSDPWPESFFHGELDQPLVFARVAERDGAMVGYSVAWLGAGTGHLGNLAVVPSERRRGIASRLVHDLLDRARALEVENLTLEVRVSNFAAQALYRAHGFRLAGLRRGYYRDRGEDALIMEWRAEVGATHDAPVAFGR